MADIFIREFLMSQLCSAGIPMPDKIKDAPVEIKRTLKTAGYCTDIPTNEIPLAYLPGMLRLDKESWLSCLSVDVAFSADVEDGDLVRPVSSECLREFSNVACANDAVWEPVNRVMGATKGDMPKLWGIAYKHVGRVMLGPVVFHHRFAFSTGDILFAGESGTLTTEDTGTIAGVCVAPGSVFIEMSMAASLNVLESRVAKLEEAVQKLIETLAVRRRG